MGKLVYITNASLDGYIADESGSFDWTQPDDEIFAFFNDLQRPIGTYLYGRRLYEVMAVWEGIDEVPDLSPALTSEFARLWRSAEKIVYSRTLASPWTGRTRIEGTFDPGEVRRLKAREERDISVGGAGLAGQAIAAELVDEFHLVVWPVLLGGGTRALPPGVRQPLELLDERRFASGGVHLHYRLGR